MVGLPSLESRELILRALLSKEKVEEGLDFKELATITEGYSGSDLKVFIKLSNLDLLLFDHFRILYLAMPFKFPFFCRIYVQLQHTDL